MEQSLDAVALLVGIGILAAYVHAVKKDYKTTTAGAVFRVALFILAIFFAFGLIHVISH